VASGRRRHGLLDIEFGQADLAAARRCGKVFSPCLRRSLLRDSLIRKQSV